MFDHQFIASWVNRLRSEIPETAAVLLKGSAARGEPGPYSDLDLDVLVDPGPRDDYLAWIEEHGGRPVHVSVAVIDVTAWFDEATEPVRWAYGFPARETTRLLWARHDALRTRLDRPWREHPPSPPELEDTVDALGKVRNAFLAGDDLGVRQAAMSVAQWVPSLLIPFNPPVFAEHPREALDAVLSFPTAPSGYRGDMVRCLGMSGVASTARDVHDATARLVSGTLPMLRDHLDVLEGKLPADLHAMLADGTLERYVAFMLEDPEDGPDRP